MKSWNASLLVCDDLLYSLAGKLTLLGVYTGDISIPAPTWTVGQLVFLFLMNGDLTERPTQPLDLEVTLPGSAPQTMVFPTSFAPSPASGRTKWFLRTPFLLQNVILRPGRIAANVKHGDFVMNPGSPWVTGPSA
jgi:hypothetical protein